MRLAFMGTSEFAVPSLESLIAAGHELAAVYTQPDRPSGRGRKVHFSPIKERALGLGLGLDQPESLKADEFRDAVAALSLDAVVVVAYGKLLPTWLLELPRYGVVNVHGSLLPKYRGAAPINWAIVNGEDRTGVSTMKLDEGMDTGPVYITADTPIDPDETAPQLSGRLAVMGAALLTETLGGIERGVLEARPQNDGLATMAPRLKKSDGYVAWNDSALAIHNRVRGLLPWPSVVVGFREKTCRILQSRLIQDGVGAVQPGSLSRSPPGLRVCCGDGRWLGVEKVQLENKKAVSGIDFANGVHLTPEDRFTSIGTISV